MSFGAFLFIFKSLNISLMHMCRFVFSILFFAISVCSYANMSSPWIKGSITSEAYSSKDIDIIKENIHIKLIDLYKAEFKVVYTVKSDRQGLQIPLVFDTMTDDANDGSFNVWVDNVEIPVSNIPSTYDDLHALQWIDSLDSHLRYSQDDIPNLIGLKYFEVDLPKGVHTIRVEYIAAADIYLGNSIKEFSFKYNLEPARYWRSFKDLHVIVDASILDGLAEVDLLDKTEFTGVKEWHFSELPQNIITISYVPNVSWLARFLVALSPTGLAIILTLAFIALHVYLVLRYRIKNPLKKISPIVIVGSILVPFIYCCLFIFAYDFVDWVIGDSASGRHGYLFFVFFMYPIFVMFYMAIIWFVDKCKKSKLGI